ncbi:hypothetical protein BCBD1442_13980 [Brucella ceti]|nr:hypothetical protein BCBD1442_13980 [Brucella ceti]
MQNEYVFAAHVFLNLHENFLISEATDAGLAEWNVEILSNGFGKNPVGVACEKFHSFASDADAIAVCSLVLSQKSVVTDIISLVAREP